MILLTHIVIATASLLWTGYVFFYPSKQKLNVAYGLVGGMLISGFYLILSKPAHMTQTCVEGLVYLGIVSYGLVSARNKLVNKI